MHGSWIESKGSAYFSDIGQESPFRAVAIAVSGYLIADSLVCLHEKLSQKLFDANNKDISVRSQALREAKKMKRMWSRLHRMNSQSPNSKDTASGCCKGNRAKM